MNIAYERTLLRDERTMYDDERFESATDVLRRAIEDRVFPGAAFAVTHGGRLVAAKGVGRFTYDAQSPRVGSDTVYDLASVTKVVATTAMAMCLYDTGELSLDARIVDVVPAFASEDARRNSVTIGMLLSHSSGLPGYLRLFETAHGRGIVDAACAVPLEADPGTRAEYSDIGFIVLGEALSRIAGKRISEYCEERVFGPLSMASACYRPRADMLPRIPPTEVDATGSTVFGIVHDENARAANELDLGHAGLFTTAIDVARFTGCMLRGGDPILRSETVDQFTKRVIGTRALGWDTPSAPSQSGRHFGKRAYGHLGFTGTSVWADPDGEVSVTLLTNRTYPNRDLTSEAIKRVRAEFHDAVMSVIRADT